MKAKCEHCSGKGYVEVLNKKFRDKRVSINMTQKQLAKHLGVVMNTVSRYERGLLSVPKSINKLFSLLILIQRGDIT